MQPKICLITGSTLGSAEYVAEHLESVLQQQGFSTELHQWSGIRRCYQRKNYG